MVTNSSGKADFRVFGARVAFPENFLSSWGACLVEPPGIGALRRTAADRLIRLGDLALPKYGIPTRVVGYFCLEELTDPQVLAQMGIRSGRDRQRLAVVRDGRGAIHLLEREALKPMLRRPGDLDGRIDVRQEHTEPWRMLYLTYDKDELGLKRWSHTLAYIRYGEVQDFPAKEGSRRGGGVPAQRSQVRVRPVWFQVPRIPTGAGRVCWLIGRGDRHYAPTMAEGLLVPNNFMYSAPPSSLARPRVFAAIANLSWTHLMAEVYGRRGGGDGVLHTYIRDLAMLPLIDPKKLTVSQAEDLISLFDDVARRPVLPVTEELQQADRQAFDGWAMSYLFGQDADTAGRSVERALRDLVMERMQRSVSGREERRKAVRRTAFDPAPIAARVLIDCGRPPTILGFLPDMDSTEMETLTLVIPRHALGRPEVGETLFDQGEVLISGTPLISTPTDSHSLAIVALLTTNNDYAGEVLLPARHSAMEQSYRQWEGAWGEWRDSVERNIVSIFPKAQQVERRVLVARELESRTSLPKYMLRPQ